MDLGGLALGLRSLDLMKGSLREVGGSRGACNPTFPSPLLPKHSLKVPNKTFEDAEGCLWVGWA